MIELGVEGLGELKATNAQMALWGKKPFKGKSALRIRTLWTKRIKSAFSSKGKSIGENWPPLSPAYKSWKSKHYPRKPLLVLTGKMKDSLVNPSSRMMIFNKSKGTQLILGTRISYAKFHQYGTKKMPKRQFFKVDQGFTDGVANEMRKDLEIAMKGRKTWLAR